MIRGMRPGGIIAWLGSLAALTACLSAEPPPLAREPSSPPAQVAAPAVILAPPPASTRAAIVDWSPVVMRCLQKSDECGGSADACRALASRTDDARASALRCFDASSCTAFSDCFHTLLTARAAIVDWSPVVMRCLQKSDECGGSAATCRGLSSLADEAQSSALRCFDEGSCATFSECFRAFLAVHAATTAPATGK